MSPRLQFSIGTLLTVVTLSCVALWINTRPPHVTSYTGKAGDILHAEGGWPFHYQDVYQTVAADQAARYIRNGWPRTSGLPVVSNGAKLIANVVVLLVFVVGIPTATQFAIAYVARRRAVQFARTTDTDSQSPLNLRVRLIPTTLLLVLGAPGLIIGSATLLFSVWEWIDIAPSDYSGGMLFYPAFKYAFFESCLAISASVLLLLAANACWHSGVLRACLFSAIGFSLVFVLLFVVNCDVYNGWDDYAWPLTRSR